MKCEATISDRMNPAPTARMPISAPPLGSRLPKNTIRKNDAKGNAAMIQLYLITPGSGDDDQRSAYRSPLQQVDLVDVDGLAVAVDEDHDGQADADLGRGHSDHEEREHLPRDQLLLQELGEGHEIDVHS